MSPLTANHRTKSAEPGLAADANSAERQRIAKAIDQAQRAQAGLLLASIGAERVAPEQDTATKTTVEQTQPFKAHPYLLPRGAPPQLVSQAMEQALAKYQSTLQQRNTATTAASPRATPTPIQ